MKKYAALSILIASILAFSSCSGTEQNTSDASAESTPSVTDTSYDTAEGEITTQASTEPLQTESEPAGYETAEDELELDDEIEAEYASLLDVRSSTILFEKGGLDTKIYPASTTKLITALVALKHCDPETTVFTAGDELDLVQPGSSLAYILEGHKLKLDTLIAGMLMKSGNDAAYVTAAGVGKVIADDNSLSAKEAVNVFVREMNRFAEENGMDGSHFTCPDGFHDDDHYTTMCDMLTVAKLAVQNEVIMKYTQTVEDKFYYASGENITWTNTNALINPNSPSYYKYVTGLKTGTTDEAGNCVLASAEKDGRVLIACIFRHPDSDGKFSDAAELFSSVFGTK